MLPTLFATLKKREITAKPKLSSAKVSAILIQQANQEFQQYLAQTNAELNETTIPAYAQFAVKGSSDAASALITAFGRLTYTFAFSPTPFEVIRYGKLVNTLYEGLLHVCQNGYLPVRTARLNNICINRLVTQINLKPNYLAIILNSIKQCVDYGVKESLEASYLLAKYYAGCLAPLGDLDQSLATFFNEHIKCVTDKTTLALMYAEEGIPAALVYIQHEIAAGRYTPPANTNWDEVTITKSTYLKAQAIHYLKISMALAINLNTHPIQHDSLKDFFIKTLNLYEQIAKPDRTDAFFLEVLDKVSQLTTSNHMRRLRI